MTQKATFASLSHLIRPVNQAERVEHQEEAAAQEESRSGTFNAEAGR